MYRYFLPLACCVIQAGALQAEDTIRLLCIGNSFSWDAVEQELVPLCNAAGQAIVVGNLYYGGCSLAQHHGFLQQDTAAYEFRYLTNDTTIRHKTYSLRQAITRYRWDYVSFQQASHDSGITSTYEPYLSALIDSVLVYQPHATLCWMQTWSYARDAKHPAFPRYQNSQRVMDDSIQVATRHVLRQHPALHLVPCGEAIRLARRRLGDTLCRDGYHLNYTYGRYLASCVWMEFLRGEESRKGGETRIADIRRNPYRNPAMSRREQRTTQGIAHRVAQ
ncbi:MAG: DUF4886 domain-containing protein [Paludibacteraceae bacterium]